MRRPALPIAFSFAALTVAQYTCLAATCISTYEAFPELSSKEPWEHRVPQPAYSSGNFTCPLPADRNSSHPSNTDYGGNERITVGENFTVEWTQNGTKNASWELYLVDEEYERYFLYSTPGVSASKNASLERYFWLVRENDFVKSGGMYFFYFTRKDGFWSEGFASRCVNISRAEERGLTISKMTSGADRIRIRPRSTLMLALTLMVPTWMAYS